MYKQNFGTKQQISFNAEEEYYEFLGYLLKGDGSSILVWEHNDEQGAWAKEGRILFFTDPPQALRVTLSHTAGNGNIISRVNCNEFILNLIADHHFALGSTQNVANIRSTIPAQYIAAFDGGLNL